MSQNYLFLLMLASVMDIYWSMGVGATTYFADENALKVYLDITF